MAEIWKWLKSIFSMQAYEYVQCLYCEHHGDYSCPLCFGDGGYWRHK